MTRLESKVLDAWVLLARPRGEQSTAVHVTDRLKRAEEGSLRIVISWINVGEVYYMLARKHDARREGATLITGDPELREMTDALAIEWIGPGNETRSRR